jgi:hypothetical protein
MKGLVKVVLAFAGLALVVAGLGGAAGGGKGSGSVIERALSGELQPARIPAQVPNTKVQTTKPAPFFSAGLLASAAEAVAAANGGDRAAAVSDGAAAVPIGQEPRTVGCSKRNSNGNVRVNQDCSFRRQAEEDITFNPADPTNLLAGQNDSRVGFNQCGIDWSTDNGRHWGDLLPPFRSKVNSPEDEEPAGGDHPNRHTIRGGPGTLHSYDAASDPTVAFDSTGRGYFSCVIFDVFDDASGIFVTASPTGAQGAFFFNVSSFSHAWIPVEDNSARAAHDKQFITADTYASSPNKNNVYVTWTVFDFGCGPSGTSFCQSPIYGSMSTNGGVEWSTPEEISGSNASLCILGNFFDPSQGASDCNLDQGSDPIVLPDGDLVVTFNNTNTPTVNTQQLAVHCHPTGKSELGTAQLNCGEPHKVGDGIEFGAPLCDFGRGPEECIPGAFIRTNAFPRIEVNTSKGEIYVTWQDYRHGEWDIQLARSTDGGLTWSETKTVNPDTGLDHYFAAVDIRELRDDSNVAESYYRTERVPGEPGPGEPSKVFEIGDPGVGSSLSDYVLAGGLNLVTPFEFKVLSPVFPAPDGIQAGFNGDYSGLTIPRERDCHPIWSDTRNADPFAPANEVEHDEDIFSDSTRCPNGQGTPGPGTIGQG